MNIKKDWPKMITICFLEIYYYWFLRTNPTFIKLWLISEWSKIFPYWGVRTHYWEGKGRVLIKDFSHLIKYISSGEVIYYLLIFVLIPLFIVNFWDWICYFTKQILRIRIYLKDKEIVNLNQ